MFHLSCSCEKTSASSVPEGHKVWERFASLGRLYSAGWQNGLAALGCQIQQFVFLFGEVVTSDHISSVFWLSLFVQGFTVMVSIFWCNLYRQ